MEKLRCPSCATEVRPEQATCPHCGEPLDHDTSSAPIPVSRAAYDAYWPIGPLGHWLIVFLIGIGVLSVVSIGSAMMQERVLAQIQQGVQVPPATVEANDSRELVLSMLELGVLASTATLFLIWFFRAHRNLTSFGMQGLKYTPWWTVGGFLVPFLNLVRPYQVMKEVWWGSDPGTPQAAPAAARRGSPLLGWWWGSYLVMNLASTIVAQVLIYRGTDPGNLRLATQLDIVASGLTIVAAIFAAGVVREVSVRQADKFERMYISREY